MPSEQVPTGSVRRSRTCLSDSDSVHQGSVGHGSEGGCQSQRQARGGLSAGTALWDGPSEAAGRLHSQGGSASVPAGSSLKTESPRAPLHSDV